MHRTEEVIIMINFTQPPELMTGITDIINFFVSGIFLVYLLTHRKKYSTPWIITMALLTFSNIAGGIVHTLDFPALTDRIIWVFLSLILCMTSSMFVVCAEQEKKVPHLKRTYIIFTCLGFAGFAAMMVTSLFYDRYILVYVAYCAVVLIYALVLFTITAIKRRRADLIPYIAGLVIQIPGGIIQAQRKLYFTVIWQFDFNSAYHSILTLTMVLIIIGYIINAKKIKE